MKNTLREKKIFVENLHDLIWSYKNRFYNMGLQIHLAPNNTWKDTIDQDFIDAILALFRDYVKDNKPISSYTDAQVELDRYEKSLLKDL